MSYYSGGRRYALGGKGWTLVLGTTVSLSYIRARAKMYDEDNSQSYHKALKNEKGETLTFHDQTTPAGPQEDIVIRMWRELPDLPLPNLYAVGGLLTAFWAYRMHGTFDRLMIVRFADVGYQLRRPDVLANKVLALKYLALPLAVIPVGALGCFFFLSGGDGVRKYLRQQASALKATLAEPYREASNIAHDVLDPVAAEIESGSLAEFARRSQIVGREPHGLSTRPSVGDSIAHPGEQPGLAGLSMTELSRRL
mmetsp:Transcript_24168/g.63803  ORF Transcript_24168/g.63803 Transcript_24168/m.63803 type:complete len:253 (-) Transcript_24168:33-791(-)